jgi:HAMP domain-containing protein
VRARYAYTRWWSALLVEPVELVSFVMSKRMLRGIRQRATAARD